MEKTVMAMALLGLLTLVALSWRVESLLDHTHVVNKSSKTIVATITYNFPYAKPRFTNRVIPPSTEQSDQYNNEDCELGSDTVSVEVWVSGSGSSAHKKGVVDCDDSVVGFDTYDKTGVNISQATSKQINTPHRYLFTIYP